MATVGIKREDICFQYSTKFQKRQLFINQADFLYKTACNPTDVKQVDFNLLSDIRHELLQDDFDILSIEDNIKKYASQYKIDLSSITENHNPPVEISLPKRKATTSSNFTMCAAVDKIVILEYLKVSLIPLGLSLTIPHYIELQIKVSNELLRSGVTILNGIFTVQSDNAENITIPLINFGTTPVEINRGDIVAQCSFSQKINPDFVEMKLVENLKQTG